MDDEADLKKMIEVLKSTREENAEDLQFQEFINFDDSDGDEDDEYTTQDLDLENNFNLDISTLYKYNPISSLKPEEKAVIDSCRDRDLKKLLLLNRKQNMQLIQLYKKFKDLLIECKQNILEKNEIVKQYFEAFRTQRQSSGSWRVVAPYFKDKGFYVSPPNSDTIKKKNNKELSYYDLMPLKKWSKYECDRLVSAVKLNYNNNIILQLKKEIRMIKSGEATEDEEEEVEEKQMRLNNLTNSENFEIPPLGSDENINWIRVADVFIRDKHSDFECRSFWHIYLHPSVNKAGWFAEENNKLKELAKKYKYQNWDLIAKDLDTNRTCFSVARQYFSNLHTAHKKGEFTIEEDRKLLDLVNKYRIGNHIPWVQIVRHFKYRTRCQLHHRFTYYLSQVDKRKGKFSEAEDVMILLVVAKHGTNYRKCAEYLTERSINQIKGRYTSNLRGLLNKYIWSVEDDEAVMEHAKKNDQKSKLWGELTSKLKRSRGQIRQRYIVVKNFLEQNPGSTIHDVTRRKHKHKSEDSYSTVRRVADYFLEKSEAIPSIEEIEEELRQYHIEPSSLVPKAELMEGDNVKIENNSKNIDDLLTEFFCNSHMQPGVILNTENLKQAVDEVEALLDILNINLVIPKHLDDSHLDYIDMEIIAELRKRNNFKRRDGKEIKRLVPASFHTATTMRSLLVKYLHYKNEKIAKKEILPYKDEKIFGNFDVYASANCSKAKTLISEETSCLPDVEKRKLQADRNLFYRRFLSLLNWPAILTLEPPSREFASIMENINIDSRPPAKRTYSRKNRSEDDRASKVRILDENVRQSLQLTPVTDKSVIVNLLKDNSRKLFCMDKVQCGTQTKTFLKEVDLDFLTRKGNETGSAAKTQTYSNKRKLNNVTLETPGTSKFEGSPSSIEDNGDVSLHAPQIIADNDDDLLDLQKLTNFIKKEKGGH